MSYDPECEDEAVALANEMGGSTKRDPVRKETNPFTAHDHKCPKCGTIFGHNPNRKDFDHDRDHTCPVPGCGGFQTWVYRGEGGASYHCHIENPEPTVAGLTQADIDAGKQVAGSDPKEQERAWARHVFGF